MADKTNTLKEVEIKLKTLTSTPTTETAKSKIEEIKKRTECLVQKLDTLRNSTEVVSAEEKKEILNGHDKILREYR